MAAQTVTIEVSGRLITGTVCIANQFLSVSFGNASKTTLYHGVRPHHIAKQLLRQLVLRPRPKGSLRRRPL